MIYIHLARSEYRLLHVVVLYISQFIAIVESQPCKLSHNQLSPLNASMRYLTWLSLFHIMGWCQLRYVSIVSCNGLVPRKWQAITWNNNFTVHWLIPTPQWVNSLRLSDTYMHQWPSHHWLKKMAWRLLGAKPLSEPMQTWSQLDHKEQNSMKY